MSAPAKITYTSASGDLDEFHHRFDVALEAVRAAAGARHPFYIGGQPVDHGGEPLVDRSPIDTGLVLGRFAVAPGATWIGRSRPRARRSATGPAALARAARVLRRAAALIRERKYELAALMSLEVGKSRLEAMGDAEESADLIDYYCGQVEEADGFVRPMGRITPVERNTDVLRPYGVFACIAPFNFPLALSAGMSSAALAAGNAVVYKPAEDTPWTGLRLYEIYRDAGLPAGRVQPAGRPPGRDRRPALAASRRRRRGVHGLGAGEHHAVDAGVLPERVADRLPVADEQVEHARREPRVAVDLVQPEAGPGRVFRRLVDHGVARGERGRRHPGRQRERKIERRDAGEHAIRSEDVGVPLDRRDPPHRADEPVGLLDLRAVVIDQVGRLLRVAHGLEPALAHLQAHDGGELVLALPDEGGRAPEHREPLAPGEPGPAALRLVGRGDRAIHVRRPGDREPSQHEAGVDRRAIDQRLVAVIHRARRRRRTGAARRPRRARPRARRRTGDGIR